MERGLARALSAEALGTGLLVATVVGSGIMAQRLTGIGGLQLLCNTLPTGAMLFVLICVFGPLSGAQLNPAVTFSLLLRREMALLTAAAFIAAQIAGAAGGTVIAHAMFAQALLQTGSVVRTGAALWLSEGVATFGLILTIYGVRERGVALTAAAVALYIVAAYWFTASTSFANPAVTLARTLTASYSGIRPADASAFIAAQILAASLGGWLSAWLFARPANMGMGPADS